MNDIKKDQFIIDAKLQFYKETDELIGGTFKDHVRDAVWTLVEQKLTEARIDECQEILTDRSIFNMPPKIQQLLLKRISQLESKK